MEKWSLTKYRASLTLGENDTKITGSKKHIALSREAAGEGIVLLKNEGGILPLACGTRLAVFGKAQIDYVKGGGGSGDVHCEYVRNICDGIREKTGRVELFERLSEYYTEYTREKLGSGGKNGMLDEAEIPSELLTEARSFTDTAIITVNRYSQEGKDRRADGTDSYFALSSLEKKMVDTVCESFENVIVLLNTGAMIDTSWFSSNPKIKAALMIWQGGMEGACAAADVLVGDVNPSGKLVDTCAMGFEDYPSSDGFHESDDYVKYTEDIFVGYRYFETIPDKKDAVVYPFGFGLSYTEFAFLDMKAEQKGEKIFVSLRVKNVGKVSGKEVVQVYYSAPYGKITKSAIELAAFAKTSLLAPEECETVTLSFDINSMASYDDIGEVERSCYVLEKGEYKILVGKSVRNTTELEYKYTVSATRVVERLTEYCAPRNLGKRLTASGEYVAAPEFSGERKEFPCEYVCESKIPEDGADVKTLEDVYLGKCTLDDFMAQLTDEEMMWLLLGTKNTGVANTDGMGGLERYGIPAPMTADGPAGVRISPSTGIRTTAFPVATMLACTWNVDILERVGAAGALEAKENALPIWLTPALNIHRSPLCGRNFEYYSEDPLISGKMAAAMVRGIQSQGIVATPKHLACNNKETNRKESDSIVSERALREIYLKGFEICVKESGPRLLMSSYNVINGVRASENAELLTGILRGEWGYDGLVTSDWNNTGDRAKEIIAGNDISMPSTHKVGDGRVPRPSHVDGVTRNELAASVKRLMKLILELE